MKTQEWKTPADWKMPPAKGPWRVGETDPAQIIGADDALVCEFPGPRENVWVKGNIGLIVAALEMFEALDWALTYGEFPVAEDNPMHGKCLLDARKLLARVKAGER